MLQAPKWVEQPLASPEARHSASRPTLRHPGVAPTAPIADVLEGSGYDRFREGWAIRLMAEIRAHSCHRR